MRWKTIEFRSQTLGDIEIFLASDGSDRKRLWHHYHRGSYRLCGETVPDRRHTTIDVRRALNLKKEV